MAERGQVRSVAWLPQGSELLADAGVGTLSLTVANPVDFDEDGGTLDLNGVQMDYATVDQDTGIITLAAALAVAAVAGDRVGSVSGGQVAVDFIAFVTLGDGDEVEVLIPYAERDLWPEGEYPNPVLVDLNDSLDTIVAVPGRTPLRDGTFIDPATLPVAPPPAATDGVAPVNAPTGVALIGGIGALFVRWVPISNHDPVTYDLHISDTSGFTPSAATLSVSTQGSSHTLRQLTTGVGSPPDVTLHYNQTYYCRVIPRDADGTGPTSAEASGAMVQVNGPDVAAETITGDQIVGGTITGDLLSSSIVLGSKISTGALDDAGNIVGARVELGPEGLTNYAADGHAVVKFPIDPKDSAYVEANLEMLSANVRDHFTMYGVNNALAASSSMLLGSGVVAPTSPPTLSSSWDTIQLDTTTAVTPGGSNPDYNLGTFKFDPAQVTSMGWDQPNACWQVFTQRSDGMRLWRFKPDGTIKQTPLATGPWVDDFRNEHNVTGTRYGWLNNWTDGGWYIWDSIVGGGRWGKIPSSWFLSGSPSLPFLSYDEAAGQFMFCQNDTYANDTFQVRRCHTVPYVGGAIQNAVSDGIATSPTTVQRAGQITSAFYGSGDFGATRYATTSDQYTKVCVWVPGTRYNGAANYAEWDTNGIALGMAFDGTYFWSVDASGRMTKYSNWTWPTEPSTTWVGSSAYDSDATGGTHETPVGTLAQRNAARRSKLTITVPPTQDAGNPDDPDKFRVYFARTAGSATPTASAMKLITALGDPLLSQAVTIVADPTGIAPPGGIYGQSGAVNTFPAGNAAKITDGAGNTMIDAQGHGSVGMTGEVRMYAGATTPTGWLLCDGSSLVRTAYPALFAIIGTSFGQGSNSPVGTTFNLPDMRSRLPLGVGGIAALGQTEAGTPGVIAGTPPAEDAGRASRWGHSHSHSTTTTGSAHTHNIAGQVAGTSVSAGTASGFAPTNASYTGHAHGGDTGSTGSGHTHNVSTDSGIGTGTVHASTALNFIIRT